MQAKLVFFGNGRLATGTLSNTKTVDTLKENGYKIAKIFTKNTDDYKENNIPVLVSVNIDKIRNELEMLKPDIGILVSYGLIVPKSIIDIFPRGILNIHPSLLPKSRGPSPIEDTILSGNKETGVSIMQLSEAMDQGPILAQQKVKLTGSETKQYLADTLLDLGNRLLINCLSNIFSGKHTSLQKQDDSKATYTHKIKKPDGLIDWVKPAANIEREIRAYQGWPKSRAILNNIDCIIINTEIFNNKLKPGELKTEKNRLFIGCGSGSLEVKTLQPAGKKPMSAGEFIRGYLK